MKKTICIYQDKGVSFESVKNLKYTLNLILDNSVYDVKPINAQHIIKNNFVNNCKLLIIPGGADSFYNQKLFGLGNKNIKNYILGGGSFLGICAGAYYASKFVEFDKNGPLEICEARELKLFNDKAIGPILKAYDYHSNSGSILAKIKQSFSEDFNDIIKLYYNGGPYFSNAYKQMNTKILASYQINRHKLLAALVKINFGVGKVILSGVHFEYCSKLLDVNDKFQGALRSELSKNEKKRIAFSKKILNLLNIKTN